MESNATIVNTITPGFSVVSGCSKTRPTSDAISRMPSAKGAAAIWKTHTPGNVIAIAKPRDRAYGRVLGAIRRSPATSQIKAATLIHSAKAII
jgi:hypothetical protein